MEEVKKKSSSSSMAIILVVVLIVVVGAIFMFTRDKGETTASLVEKVSETISGDVDISSISDMGAAIKSGKSMKCTIDISDKTEDAAMVYWIKGEKMRSEIVMGGKTIIAIMKDDKTYLEGKNYGRSDCDWVAMTETEDELDDYKDDLNDYEGYSEEENTEEDYAEESNLEDILNCVADNFGNEKFDTSGKVCELTY